MKQFRISKPSHSAPQTSNDLTNRTSLFNLNPQVLKPNDSSNTARRGGSILFALLLLAVFWPGNSILAQNDEAAIREAVSRFAAATEGADTEELEKLLAPDFRVVMHRLFGESTVTLDRTAYLSKISSGEFGGQERSLKIHEVMVKGNTATVTASFKGAELSFYSFLLWVRNPDGDWVLIEDLPTLI